MGQQQHGFFVNNKTELANPGERERAREGRRRGKINDVMGLEGSDGESERR